VQSARTYRRGGGRRALPGVEGDGLAGGGVPDDDEGAPAEAAGHGVHHAEAERGGHGGVHRVPARAQRRGAHLRAPRVVCRRRAHAGLHLVRRAPAPPRGARGATGDAGTGTTGGLVATVGQEQHDARQREERRGDGQRRPRAAAPAASRRVVVPVPPDCSSVVSNAEERAPEILSVGGHGCSRAPPPAAPEILARILGQDARGESQGFWILGWRELDRSLVLGGESYNYMDSAIWPMGRSC